MDSARIEAHSSSDSSGDEARWGRPMATRLVVRALVALSIALPVSLAACRDRGPAPPIYDATEVAALRARAAAVLGSEQGRGCERPVLRGAGERGRADEHHVALAEPDPDVAPCLERIRDTDFNYHISVKDPSALRYYWYSLEAAPFLPLDDPNLALDEEVRLCSPVIQAIRRAIAMRDACSAYLAGRRPEPKDAVMVARAASAVVASAISHARAGRPAEAFRDLADGLQFFQDLARGGANISVMQMANMGAFLMLYASEQLLLQLPGLEPGILETFERDLAALVTTAPSHQDWVRGALEYQIVLALEGLDATDSPNAKYDHDNYAAVLEYELESLPLDLQACSAGPASACWERIQAWRKRLGRRAPKGRANDLRERLATDPSAKSELRRLFVEELMAEAPDILTRYLRSGGIMSTGPAALRLVVAWRLDAARAGRCRDLAGLAEPSFAALRADPWFGGDLVTSFSPDGTLLVAPNGHLGFEPPPAGARPPALVRTRCPHPDP